MSVENWIHVFFGIIVILFCLTGCGSTGKPAGNAQLELQRRVIELENANRDLADRIEGYNKLIERTERRLEAVAERAENIGDSADRLGFIFGEYERAVWELIRSIRDANREAEAGTESQ